MTHWFNYILDNYDKPKHYLGDRIELSRDTLVICTPTGQRNV